MNYMFANICLVYFMILIMKKIGEIPLYVRLQKDQHKSWKMMHFFSILSYIVVN